MKAVGFLASVLLLIAVLITAPTAAQQTRLTEFFGPNNSNITLYYPSGWNAMYSHGVAILSNDVSAINYYNTIPMNAGEVVVTIEDPIRVTREIGATVQAVSDHLAAQAHMERITPITIKGEDGKRLVENGERLHIVYQISAEYVTYATLYTAEGGQGVFEGLFLDMLNSSEARAPRPTRTPAPTTAPQTRLTEFFDPNNSNVTLYYPSGWNAMYSHGVAILSNDVSAINYYNTIPMNAGEVVVTIEDPIRVTREIGATVQAVSDHLAAQAHMERITPITIKGEDGKRLVENGERLHIVYQINAEYVTYATLYTAEGEQAMFEGVFFDMLNSSEARAPRPTRTPAPTRTPTPTFEPTPTRRPGIGGRPSRSTLGGEYEGSRAIPVTFNYPEDWYVIENRLVASVYLSNTDLARFDPQADTIIVYIQAFPLEIPDVEAQRDWLLQRYWQFDVYGEPELIDEDAFIGIWGVLIDEFAVGSDFTYHFSADLIFEQGMAYFEGLGGRSRDFDDDEALIFAMLNTVRLRD